MSEQAVWKRWLLITSRIFLDPDQQVIRSIAPPGNNILSLAARPRLEAEASNYRLEMGLQLVNIDVLDSLTNELFLTISAL